MLKWEAVSEKRAKGEWMKLKRFLLVLCLAGWSLAEIRAVEPRPSFLIEIAPVKDSRFISIKLTNKSTSNAVSDVRKYLEASVLLLDGKSHSRTKGVTWRGTPDLCPGCQLEIGLSIDDWGLQGVTGSHRFVLEIAGQRSKPTKVKLR